MPCADMLLCVIQAFIVQKETHSFNAYQTSSDLISQCFLLAWCSHPVLTHKTSAGLKSNTKQGRVAEVARGHGGPPPKSLDSDENFKPGHTLFCRELRFVAIYALFGDLWAKKSAFFA